MPLPKPLLLLLVLSVYATAQSTAQNTTQNVSVQFVSESGVSLEALSAGEPGSGFLLYYLPQRGPERPSLVVYLSTSATQNVARAEVYQAPPELTYVPVTRQAVTLQVNVPIGPILTFEAEGGWWVQGGRVNYNLDISVDGPIYAMWGGGYEPETGFSRWTAEVELGEPAVEIKVRDPNHDGVPDWDLRSLLPRFVGKGYLRTNYTERKCDSPLEHHSGPSPLWPFVAQDGHFEQPVGRLYPPIVVDWQRGKIIYFSEMVTARNQNCSYTIYSQFPLRTDRLNELNFEYPFAFYDLSEQGEGHPNLILRTERFPAGDPYFVKGRTAPKDLMAVRYSWRNEVGDWRWDYKVEVLGFHPYKEETAIAGGEITVDAPSYETFPTWVTERSWPVTTFIHNEAANYRSSEGIYEWPTRNLGDDYLYGWQEAPNSRAFVNIRQGLRSEYRYERDLQPELYVSPVDNRLHLLGAEGGVWNLGNSLQLVTENLSGNLFLDRWRLEEKRLATDGEEVKRTIAELTKLGDYLLLSEGDTFTLQRQRTPDSLLRLLPPTDRASWGAFQAQIAPFEVLERDPLELQSWLSEGTPRLTFWGVRMSDLRVTQEGFRFVLNVSENASQEGDLALGTLGEIIPGRVVMHYLQASDTWTSTPAAPAQLNPALNVNTQVTTLSPTQFTLTLQNEGDLDWYGPVTLRLGNTVLKHWNALLVPAQGSLTDTVAWTFDEAGRYDTALRFGSNTVPLQSLEVRAATRVQGLEALLLPVGNAAVPALALLGVLFAALVSVWRIWRFV